MATATTVARPAHTQTHRSRREFQRPSITKRSAVMDSTTGESSAKKRKLNEPYVRTAQHILQKFRGRTPSMVLHLHDTYFRFDGQEGSWALNSPMKVILQHIRHQTVPHEMMEDLLANNVQFYDGCLIIEIHNHRSANGKDKNKRHAGHGSNDAVKCSMHNYDGFVTPSPMAPYPKTAKIDDAAEQVEKTEDGADGATDTTADDKTKEGPKISTLVLQPTPLSRHHEMLILARTPLADANLKRKSTDGGSLPNGQPPTPQHAAPSTPIGAGSRGALGPNQKMCLEQPDFHRFEGDVLLATEPPLYLNPVSNPRDAQKVLGMLEHPLHNERPPSPKTRKRTTAEMAADDAQAAEAERRMLIMDERIKPSARSGSGAASNETQGAAASLVHSRFKTIQMVREKHEEQERAKKEEEARLAAERRSQDEANAAAAQQQQQVQAQQLRIHQANKQRELMAARARQQQQQQQEVAQNQIRAQQLAANQQNAQMANQNHAQQTAMLQSQPQASFQHATAMSPVARQQTPMVNSSPMIPQNGFPMTATSSQGAGSPPRPTSAAMANQNMAMARQASQQQHASRMNTPQISQGTPDLQALMSSRQLSQTPGMPHGSPAPGTPTTASMPNLPMQTPNQAQLRPEQLAMLAAAQQHSLQNQQGGAMHANSPNQQNHMASMTPEQIQKIRQQQMARSLQAQAQAQAAGQSMVNPQIQAMMRNRAMQQHAMLQQQAQQQQQRMLQQGVGPGQARSPGMGMGTPQMNQAHLQQSGNGMNAGHQMTLAQRTQQMQLREAQQQLQQLAHQYGGSVFSIPNEVIQTHSPLVQTLMVRQRQQSQAMRAAQQQQQQQSQAARAQQMALRAQQAQMAGQAVVGTSGGDPGFMQSLRNQHGLIVNQHGVQAMNNNVNGMHGFGGQGQGNETNQQMAAAFQNAMRQRQQSGNGIGGMQ